MSNPARRAGTGMLNGFRRWGVVSALLLCLLAAGSAPARAAGGDDLTALQVETAELWLNAGRIWLETAAMLTDPGPAAAGDRYRALLYAKLAYLKAATAREFLTADQQAELTARLAELEAGLEALTPLGYLNLTRDELFAGSEQEITDLTLAGQELELGDFRFEVLREWIRTREVWTEVEKIWAAAGDEPRRAEVAARLAEIDRSVLRLREAIDAERALRAQAPAPPRRAIPAIPVPEIRFYPPDTTVAEPAATATAETEAPLRTRAGIIDIRGPLESTLVINGRKFIKMSVSATMYPDATDQTLSSTSLDIQQQLQVHIAGKVGQTITVNVDYDDAKPEVERQTMSITYDGLEHQTPVGRVQGNAAFGDISLSIPSTQYVSYNTSLFGVMGGVDVRDFHLLGLRADRISFDGLVTRTKGIPGRKVFYGAATTVLRDIDDVSYLARKYYRVTDDSGIDLAPLAVGGVVVYVDDHNAATNNANTLLGMTVSNGSETYTGDFDVKQEGPDYTLDTLKGILKFRSTIGSNYVIAVDYQTTAGWSVAGKLIRDENGSDTYMRYEQRNRYDLGSLNILTDDPDFIFEIWGSDDRPDTDASGDGVSDTTWIYYFGLDRGGLPGNDGALGTADDLPDGKVDREWIDFDFGLVTFPETEPFRVQNPSVYSTTNPIPRFALHLEYKQKTQSYMLGNFNIIKGSDRVTINGNEVGKDQYYIDYESGFLTFYNPDLIAPNTEIAIDYQYLPFGGQFQQTALATRTELEINPNLMLGTTIVQNWDADAGSMPEVTDSPKKNTVWDVNTVLNPLNLAVDLWNLLPGHDREYVPAATATLSLTAEYAQSIHQPNTYGTARIDNLESLEEVLAMPINAESWQWSTVPSELAIADRGVVNLEEITASHDPAVDAGSNPRTLRLTYDFNNADTWVAIRYPISSVVRDLTNMKYLQLWARGATAVQFGIDLGVVSEDITGDGAYQTEDVNPYDGKLNTGEDNGLDGAAGTGDYGEADGRLTTEDMDGDNQLDTLEAYFRYTDVNVLADTYQVGEWIRYRIPLERGDTIGEAALTLIKHIRIRLLATTALTGTVDFDLLEVVGNRWTDDDLGDTRFTIGTVNTKDDPGYAPPREILDREGKGAGDFEQSLTLTSAGLTDTGAASLVLLEKQRYSKYRKLHYWVFGDGSGATFFFRFGADQSNYFEHRVTLSFVGWQEEIIDLPSLTDLLIGAYENFATPFNLDYGEFRLVGEPSLETIKELRAGLYGNGGNGTVYFNEIFLSEPIKETGDVWSASFSSSFRDGLVTLNGSTSRRDNQFQLLGESTESGEVEPKDNRSFSLGASVAAGRLLPAAWQVSAPVSASWAQDRTKIRPESVDNVKRGDLGINESDNRSLSLALSQPDFPSLSVSHNNSENFSNNVSGISESNSRSTSLGLRYGAWPTFDVSRAISLSRTASTSTSSTSRSENWSANSSYSYAFPTLLFGVVPTGKALSFSTSYGYTWAKAASEYIVPDQVPTFNNTRTDKFGLNLNVQPVAQFGVTPAFNYDRTYHWTPAERGMTNRNRSLSLGFSLPAGWGFSPGLSGNGNFNESFYAVTDAGWWKDVSTGASYNFSLGMDPRQWWSGLSFLNIRYSYSNSASASYKQAPISTNLMEVYDDYFTKVLWFWTPQEPDVTDDPLALLRNSSSNTSNHGIDGNFAFWSPLWLGYNFGYNRARSQSQNSITPTNTLSAGLQSRLNLKEAMPNWLKTQPSNTLSASYAYKQVTQVTALTTSHSPSTTWSVKWNDHFNTNFTFNFSQTGVDDREVHTIDRTYTPSLTLSYFFMNPFRITSPVTGSGIEFQNQFTWDNSLNYSLQRKIGDPSQLIDKYNYGMTSSLSYSLRSNITASVSGNFAYYVDQLLLGMNHYDYGVSGSAEIRF